MGEEKNSITNLEEGLTLLEEGPRRVFDLDDDLFEQVVSSIDSVKGANRLMETTPENIDEYREKCDVMVERFKRNIEDSDQLRAVFMVDDTDAEVDQRLVDYYSSKGIRVFQSKIDPDKYAEMLKKSFEQKANGRTNIPFKEAFEHGMRELFSLFGDPDNDIWILEEITNTSNI